MTEKLKLKECCEVITDGDHLPPPKATHGIPFITISNINANNEISFDDTMYVPIEYYDGLSETKKAKSEDVLLSVVGSFGKPVYIEKDEKFTFQRHIALLRHNNKVDGRFLYYTLLNPQFYKTLDKLAIGCSQRTVTLDTLRNIEIDVPSLDIQQKIVECLSAIDEKIKINNSINNNLYQQAMTVYMHKFFRKAPNGQLKDVIFEQPKSSIQVGDAKTLVGEYPFFTSGKEILEHPTYLVDGRNILLNTGGNADVKLYIGKASYSTDTWCIQGIDNLTDYLFLFLSSINVELDKKYFQGSTLKHLQKDLLKSRSLYAPNYEEIREFNSIIQPLLTKISTNTIENNKLVRLRTWLLPMLMNGQATIVD